ncbi:MAG: hypothetical protein EZS28_051521, partial [Streblomastix strix]
NELDTDLKLDAVRLQSPVSVPEEQGNGKDQSNVFWDNTRKRYRQDDRPNSKGRQPDVAPWPPDQPVPATSSNTVVLDHTQRQIGDPIPKLVRTLDSWKSNKNPTTKLQSKQPTPHQGTPGQPQPINQQQQQQITIYPQPHKLQIPNIIPIPTPSVYQVQQEQDHLLHPTVAMSPPPINLSNIELYPTIDTKHDGMIQPVNNMLQSQQQASNQQQLVNQQQQLFNLQFGSRIFI